MKNTKRHFFIIDFAKSIKNFDYYKEIITSYRKKVDILDIYKIQEYISYYKNESSLYETLMREVF